MLAICSAASSAIARFCLAGMSKPCSSSRVAPSPMPKSTRPSEMRSSVARPSAVRAGWLYFGITCRMPWPSRIRLRACGGRGEEHLGRRRVRVLVEEVVLDLPRIVEPEPVGELDLIERIAQEAELVVLAPRLGELMFVEDAELHSR